MRIWRSRGIRLTRIRYQPLPTYQPSACPIDNLIASIVDPYSGSELLCLRVSSTQPGLPPDGAFVLPEIYCEIQAPETTITSKNYNGGSEVGLLCFARLGANTNGTMAQKE